MMKEKVCWMMKYLWQKASCQNGTEKVKTFRTHASAFYISQVGMHAMRRWTFFRCISWQEKYWQNFFASNRILLWRDFDQIQKIKGLQRSSISKIYCQWDKIWFCWNCYFLSRFLPFCLKRLVTIFQISDDTLLAGQIKGFHVAYAKLFEGTILIFW